MRPEDVQDVESATVDAEQNAQAGPEAGGESADDVLNVIAQVEAQLDDLKKTHAERRVKVVELDQREQLIADREEELAFQIEQIKGEKESVDAARQMLDKKEERLSKLENALQSRESEFKGHIADWERQRESLRQQAEGLVARERDLEARQQQVAQTEAELESLRQEAQAARNELEESRTKTQEQQQAVQQRLDDALAELDRLRKLTGEKHAALEDAQTRVAELEQQLAEVAPRTEALEQKLADQASQLNEAEQMALEAEERADNARREADAARAQLEAAQAEAQAQAEEQASRVAVAESRVASAAAEAEDLRRQLEASTGSAEELESLRSRIAEAEQQQAEAAQRFEAERARLSERLRVATEKIRELGAALKQQMELSEQLGAATNDETTQQLLDRCERMKRELVETDERREAAEQRLAELESAGGDSDARVAALMKERDQLIERYAAAETHADEITGELKRSRESIETLRRKLRERAPKGPAGVPDQWAERRRERLNAVKKRLKEQSRKIRRASELLQDRFAQVDGLLARRNELAQAYEKIQTERDKLEKRKARTGLAWTMAAFVVMLGILSGLSWIVAEQVTPGRYAATAVLQAEAAGRELTPNDLASWQGYMQNLTNDPRFRDEASERMQRRMLTSLGTPGGLASYVEEHLTADSPADGELRLELRGDGAAFTQRALETLVVAMAAEANSTRARRADGAMTKVAFETQLIEGSLDKAKLYTAGMIFGGSALLLLLGYTVLWARMTSAKVRYERDQQMQGLLAEDDWSDPRREEIR